AVGRGNSLPFRQNSLPVVIRRTCRLPLSPWQGGISGESRERSGWNPPAYGTSPYQGEDGKCGCT
ncbi:MAG: hypothetical protein AAGE59_29145, partial [Cyanobacteria bacterium P01_F01_bin.86]